jgi:hypothetical protein
MLDTCASVRPIGLTLGELSRLLRGFRAEWPSVANGPSRSERFRAESARCGATRRLRLAVRSRLAPSVFLLFVV